MLPIFIIDGNHERLAMVKTRINWVMFGNHTGYSQAAQDYVFALDNSGRYDVRVEIFGHSPARPAISDNRYSHLLKMSKKEDDPNSFQVYHCIPTIQNRVKPHTKNIGFCTFETFQPPEDWVRILETNNGVIAPSFFDYNIFAHTAMKKPIFHIPHCIDTDAYNPDIRASASHDKFTFLFFGSWRLRKGYPQLLEAWLKEFTCDDNVQLVIKTDKSDKARTYVSDLIKQFGMKKEGQASIIFEERILDEQALPRFIKSHDALVLPTLGEGFCLPGLQCMALGIPVVITDFSGCQDYAREDTATLLPVNGYVLHRNLDKIPQFNNKKWAFVTVDSIRKAMRFVMNNPDTIRKRAKRGAKMVAIEFNYEATVRKFDEMIGILNG